MPCDRQCCCSLGRLKKTLPVRTAELFHVKKAPDDVAVNIIMLFF